MELIQKLGLLEVLIKRINCDITGDDLVEWAKQAVELAVESISLYELIELPKGTRVADALALFHKGLEEVGVEMPPKATLFAEYFDHKLSELLKDDAPQEQILDEIYREVVIALDYPRELHAWLSLSDGFDPMDNSRFDMSETSIPRKYALEFKALAPLKLFEQADRLHVPVGIDPHYWIKSSN